MNLLLIFILLLLDDKYGKKFELNMLHVGDADKRQGGRGQEALTAYTHLRTYCFKQC